MDNASVEVDSTDLLDLPSTYTILTSERILARWGLHLDAADLGRVVRDRESIYFQLLLVPFKNIINGIVMYQAYDYQVYTQKIFIDYLVSGAGNETDDGSSESTVGAATRSDLEQNRLKLAEEITLFEEDILKHKTLVGESQGKLNELIRSLKPIQDTPDVAADIAAAMRPFCERADERTVAFKNYRMEFKRLIIDTLRLLELLPDYHEDVEQDNINRASLQFDDELC